MFGNSAGGASATYLMMSPLAKGLFKGVIAESGVNLNAWAQPTHDGVAAKRAAKVAEMLKCDKSSDWKRTINCLRGAPAKDITAAFYDFFVSSNVMCTSVSVNNSQLKCARNGTPIR